MTCAGSGAIFQLPSTQRLRPDEEVAGTGLIDVAGRASDMAGYRDSRIGLDTMVAYALPIDECAVSSTCIDWIVGPFQSLRLR